MNAKICKHLREIARDITVGMPERALVLDNRLSLRNVKKSTRGVYRYLKLNYVKAQVS